jgi:hypothetical protein
MRKSIVAVFVACIAFAAVRDAMATPSTTYWAPSTTYIQPYLVPHITYDTYFWKNAAYPIDTGITIGVLPFEKVQLEIGYDLLLPSQNPVLFLLNAKLGLSQNALFNFSPSLAAGLFGVGLKGKSDSSLGDSYNIVYGQIQEGFPWGGYVSVGGYYGAGTQELWVGDDGNVHRSGFMGALSGPDINVNLPGLKKLVIVADAQTGNNVYGAAGGGIYFYFNDLVDILTGPVYFFDRAAQPGGDRWLWTVQLDIDVTLKAPPPAAPAAPGPAAPPAPVAPVQ